MNNKVLRLNFKKVLKELTKTKTNQLEKHSFGAYAFSFKSNSYFKEGENVLSFGDDNYLKEFVKNVQAGKQNIILYSNQTFNFTQKKVINFSGAFNIVEIFYFFYDILKYYQDLRLSINSFTFNSVKKTLKDDTFIVVTPGITMEELEEKLLDVEINFRNKIMEDTRYFIQIILKNVEYDYNIKCITDFLVGFITFNLIHFKTDNILNIFSSYIENEMLDLQKMIIDIKNQDKGDTTIKLVSPLLLIYNEKKKIIDEVLNLFYSNLKALYSKPAFHLIKDFILQTDTLFQIKQNHESEEWNAFAVYILGKVMKFVKQNNYYLILDDLDKVKKIPYLNSNISKSTNVCYFIKITNLQDLHNIYGMETDSIISKCSIKEISEDSCDQCKKYFLKAIQGIKEKSKQQNVMSKVFAVRVSNELQEIGKKTIQKEPDLLDFKNKKYMYICGKLIELNF